MSDLRAEHPSLYLPEVSETLAIAHSGREFGNMDYRFGDDLEVTINRARLYQHVGLGRAEVAVMFPANDGETFKDLGSQKLFRDNIVTDGFITPEFDVGLAMNLADCNAIALSDGQTLGMIHAGWRGAVNGFPNRVIERMVSAYDFDPSKAVAYFAPAIEKASYVMPELHPAQETEVWEPFIEPVTTETGEQFHIDLPGFLTHMLEVEWDVPGDHIMRSGIDVGADDTHFSYTRTKQDAQRSPNGRNGFVAVHTVDGAK